MPALLQLQGDAECTGGSHENLRAPTTLALGTGIWVFIAQASGQTGFSFLKGKRFTSNLQTSAPYRHRFSSSAHLLRPGVQGGGCRKHKAPRYSRFSPPALLCRAQHQRKHEHLQTSFCTKGLWHGRHCPQGAGTAAAKWRHPLPTRTEDA